jgi:hypothetical protein
MMSIEEVIGCLKVVDGDEPQPLSGPITVGGKLHFTQKQWEACQGLGKKGESPLSMGGCKQHKSRGGAQAGAQGRADGSGQAHVAQVEEEEPALLLAHASIELSPAALLHLDEPRAHTLLGDGSSSDKTDGWCLDTGATHHMTDRWEFITELDSDV